MSEQSHEKIAGNRADSADSTASFTHASLTDGTQCRRQEMRHA
jgi:hypothetical protein